jgi:hypothetical protein
MATHMSEHLQRTVTEIEKILSIDRAGEFVSVNEIVEPLQKKLKNGSSVMTVRSFLDYWLGFGLVEKREGVGANGMGKAYLFKWIGLEGHHAPPAPVRMADLPTGYKGPQRAAAALNGSRIAKVHQPDLPPIPSGRTAHIPQQPAPAPSHPLPREIRLVLDERTGSIGIKAGRATTIWLDILPSDE